MTERVGHGFQLELTRVVILSDFRFTIFKRLKQAVAVVAETVRHGDAGFDRAFDRGHPSQAVAGVRRHFAQRVDDGCGISGTVVRQCGFLIEFIGQQHRVACRVIRQCGPCVQRVFRSGRLTMAGVRRRESVVFGIDHTRAIAAAVPFQTGHIPVVVFDGNAPAAAVVTKTQCADHRTLNAAECQHASPQPRVRQRRRVVIGIDHGLQTRISCAFPDKGRPLAQRIDHGPHHIAVMHDGGNMVRRIRHFDIVIGVINRFRENVLILVHMPVRRPDSSQPVSPVVRQQSLIALAINKSCQQIVVTVSQVQYHARRIRDGCHQTILYPKHRRSTSRLSDGIGRVIVAGNRRRAATGANDGRDQTTVPLNQPFVS